jgi:hypothetical protein
MQGRHARESRQYASDAAGAAARKLRTSPDRAVPMSADTAHTSEPHGSPALPPRERAVAALAGGLALIYAAVALWALLVLSPRVPYADEWRHLWHILTKPADAAWLPWLAAPNNGHRELSTALARVAELQLLHGLPWLQIGLGAALWAACVLMLWRLATRPGAFAWAEPPPARGVRALRGLAVLLPLAWLASIRTLAHGNESLHSYVVIACLLAGVLLLATPGKPAGLPRLLAAAALGLWASFSFGTGVAVYVGLLGVLLLQRARGRDIGLMMGLAVLALWLYSLGFRPGKLVQFAPLEQLDLLLRWLAAPWRAALWPLIEPQVAAQLPGPLRSPVEAIALQWQSTFGPLAQARWPWLGIGAAGMALWLWQAITTRAAREVPSALRSTGLALAAFAIGTGVLVMAARRGYFLTHPEQLLAPRYFVWSTVFWGGLLLAWLARARARHAAWLVIPLALALLPSEAWMLQLGRSQRATADQFATAVRVGVLPDEQPVGENNLVHVRAAAPLLAERGDAMWHWADAAWLGRQLPLARRIAVSGFAAQPVGNRLGEAGRRVRFESDARGPHLLLVDPAGRVVGLAMPNALLGGRHWIGWARGTQGALGVAAAPD